MKYLQYLPLLLAVVAIDERTKNIREEIKEQRQLLMQILQRIK